MSDLTYEDIEPVYVKVIVMSDPEPLASGDYKVPIAIEYTEGLPLFVVSHLLTYAARALEGGEDGPGLDDQPA